MKRASKGRLPFAAIAAGLLALSASAAVAEGFDESDPMKRAVCAAMSCSEGSRVCGTATGEKWNLGWFGLDLPIWYIETLHFTCYEPVSQ